MATRVQGTLDDAAFSDTYSIWRKPGRYGYELQVRGAGSVDLLVEASLPAGGAGSHGGASLTAIETRRAIRGGSRITGTIDVPKTRVGAGDDASWIEIRVAIVKAVQSASVAYDLRLESDRSEADSANERP